MIEHELECEKALARMAGFLDRELSEVEMAQVERHLEECSWCKDAFRFEGSILTFVRRACDEEPVPADLEAKILSRLKECQ